MRDIYAYANNAHYRLQIIQTLHDLNRFQHVQVILLKYMY